MLTPFFLIDILIAFAFLCIGGVVLLKNGRVLLNRLFFYCVSFIAAWMVTNYLSNDQSLSSTTARLANHLVLFFSGLAVLFLLKFVIAITSNKFLSKHERLITNLNYVILFLTLTSLVVSGINRQGNVYAIQFGPLANIYFLSLFVNVILIIGALFVGIKKRTGEDRLKIITILWSLGAMLAINITTNAIIPLISGSFNLTNVGPLTSIILVAGLTYAIIKHKLFDIRLIVAKTIGYLLSLGAIVGIYSLLVFGLIANFVDPAKAGRTQQLIYVALAVVTALTFPPIKRFFDKLSNKLFYQDAYEPQDLLNELNNLLVSQIELNKILKDGAQIIQKYLKAFYVQFYIDATDKTEAKLVTVGDTRGSDAQKVVHGIWQHASSKLLVVDDLPEEQAALRRQLLDQDIAVIARFLSSTQQGKEVGYLVLGIKRSGSMYNKQDIRMVSIMADELVIAIQNALRFEEIEAFNITLQQKIDDATHQLRRANEKLKALDETKDEFISMASHQLRTPLTSVKGYVSMVLEGDAGKISGSQKNLLDQAFISSQRMVYLIADLLNVSRLKTGKFVIQAQPTQLADVIEGELSQLTETAKGRKLELTYIKPTKFPMVMLDETKIRQVIMNFVDNAIYYTPAGGHISVNLKDTGQSIEFTVVDDGIGVPKKEQHHMFTKFYRANNAQKARPDGTGLGLFMAQKVIVAQGGAVIFKSEEGKGSTFGFSFPKAKLKVQGVSEKPK